MFANLKNGGLAQLARALAWHARGHRFDSDILHYKNGFATAGPFLFFIYSSKRVASSRGTR